MIHLYSRNRVPLLASLALLAVMCGLPALASAATITVDTTTMVVDAGTAPDTNTGLSTLATDLEIADLPGTDGFISLPEAIIAANNTAGADTIVLASGATYTVATASNYWYGPTGLPPIVSDITIEGNNATIDASGTFRLFVVLNGEHDGTGGKTIVSAGTLTIKSCTLSNGKALGGAGGGGGRGGGGGGLGAGGAIFNKGTLTLESVTLSNNAATGGAGGTDDNSSNEYGGGAGMGGDGGDGNGNSGGGGGGFRTAGGDSAFDVGGDGGLFSTGEAGAGGSTVSGVGGTSTFGGNGGDGGPQNAGGGGGPGPTQDGVAGGSGAIGGGTGTLGGDGGNNASTGKVGGGGGNC
ncbi:MAG: hypothetical protein AB7S36_12245, partial [Planctomycetota bacterium]